MMNTLLDFEIRDFQDIERIPPVFSHARDFVNNLLFAAPRLPRFTVRVWHSDEGSTWIVDIQFIQETSPGNGRGPYISLAYGSYVEGVSIELPVELIGWALDYDIPNMALWEEWGSTATLEYFDDSWRVELHRDYNSFLASIDIDTNDGILDASWRVFQCFVEIMRPNNLPLHGISGF